MEGSKKKIVVAGVASLILIAMVVALTINTGGLGKKDVNESNKSIQSLCESTDHKDTCVESLSSAKVNSSDPRELIRVSFQAAIKSIEAAAKNSSTITNLQNDPRGKMALDDCQELANRAVDDLKRSSDKFANMDFTKMDELLEDLKIWLSGAGTYQQTCLDGFEDVQGDSGEKMKDILKTSMELTSNALAMVTQVTSVLTGLGTHYNRRLLSKTDESLHWVKRRLLQLPVNQIQPDIVIAKDGSGKYATINEALKDIPKRSNKTFIIHIKEGVYAEKVQFNHSWTNLMLTGDGPTKTRITGSLNFIDGTTTYHTATVAVLGDFFMAKDIGFENSAGAEKHQAVALRVGADKSIFFNCHMDGYQDTLYVHTYRQFYRDCKISGTIDFLFGDSAAIFQNCILEVRQPLPNQQCIVTAQGRKDPRQPTGLVLQNCSFVADPKFYPVRDKTRSYLGRPWKEFSRTVIMESFLDDLINPEGWLAWNGTFGIDSLYYTEFNNRGPASPKEIRVKWTGVKELQANRVQHYTGNKFFLGDTWIPQTGVPYVGDFMYPLPPDDPKKTYSTVSLTEQLEIGNVKDKTSYQARTDLITDSITLNPVPITKAGPVDTANSPTPGVVPNSMAPPTIPGAVPVATAQSAIPGAVPIATTQPATPGAVPVATTQPGIPGAVPVATAQPTTPGAVPVATAQPATPGAVPVATAQPATPGAVPVATAQPATPGAVPVATAQPATPGAVPVATAQPAIPGAVPVATAQPATPRAG